MIGRIFGFLGMNSKVRRIVFLFICWLCGIFIGLHIALSNRSYCNMLYLAAVREPAGFVGLAVAFFLPFLASVAALQKKMLWPLYIICIGKSIVFAIHFFSVYLCFGDGSWLLAPLFLFSEYFSAFLLLIFWLSNIQSSEDAFKHRCILYVIFSCLGIVFDFFIISKFLISLS